MSIHADVKELQSIRGEIERVQRQLATLRKLKADCESRILTYLRANDQPGIKVGGKILSIHVHTRRTKLREKDRLKMGMETLRQHGIHITDSVMNEVLKNIKGESKEIVSLKYKN